MTKEPWTKHTPGDPMPCKCGESLVETRLRGCTISAADPARRLNWGKIEFAPSIEITDWRFAERKGEDVIVADPYDALEWGEDDTATVVLKEPGQPWWVRDVDLVRFRYQDKFKPAKNYRYFSWVENLAFQINRRPALTPAEPQLLAVLSAATGYQADAIRSAARRANIEVPE